MTNKKKSPKKTANNLVNLHGVSEEEFLKVLNNISKRLGHKFKFGYHSFDDMKQQAAIFALEGLEKYDHNRPLENFLWTHVRNRLFNYKRNNYQRPDKPCLSCPFFDKGYKCSKNQCTEFENKNDCELYSAWSSRNENKKNIMQPTHIDSDILHHKTSNDPLSIISNKEIIDFLDANISNEHRETYLKIKHGSKVPKQNIVKLQNYIKLLMESDQWPKIKVLKKEDN
jgi:hypothetical protein